MILIIDTSEFEPSDETFTHIDSGRMSSCGLKSDGNAICWGSDIHEGFKHSVPEDYGPFVQLEIGFADVCGIKSDGTAQCWGWGRYGGTSVPEGETFQDIALGSYHTCGLRTDGTVSCWGEPALDSYQAEDSHGQTNAPSGTFVDVEAASFYSCALNSDGIPTCWGRVPAADSPSWSQSYESLALRVYGACGLNADGTVSCWGQDSGDTPADTFRSIESQYHHTCGVTTGGDTVCWGGGGPDHSCNIIPTETVSVEVSTPSAPQNLDYQVAFIGGSDRVWLTWDAPSEDEHVTGYQVLRRSPPDEATLQVYVEDTGAYWLDPGPVPASWLDAAVEQGQTYVYRVKAINAAGVGGQSNFVRLTIPEPEPPGAPSNLTGEAGVTTTDVSITLDWEAPSGNVGVNGYQILRRSLPGEKTLQVYVEDTGSTATEYVDANVELDTTYVYRVKAIGAGGAGEQSNFVRLTTPDAYVLAPPANLSATPTHESVTLAWDAPGDDRVTGYRIERNGEVVVADSGSTDTGYLDTNVVAYSTWHHREEVTYDYRVSAIGSDGSVSDASTVSATTLPKPLAAPINLSATASHNRVVLAWEFNTAYYGDDHHANEYIWSFQIERDGQVIVEDTHSTRTTYTDTTVAAETTYAYRVRSLGSEFRGSISPEAASVSVTTPVSPPLAPPRNLRAFGLYDYVSLTWDASRDDRVTGYRIERDGQVIVADTANTDSHYFDQSVAPATSYEYRVSAIGSDGSVSAAVSATAETMAFPPLDKPTNLSATSTEDTVTLIWNAPDDERVRAYRIERDSQVIVEDTGNTDTTYVDTGLTMNTNYRYAVSALGSDGSISFGVSVNARTDGPSWTPGAPQNLQATSESGSVTLTWDAAPEYNYITGYQILRRPIPKAGHELSIIVENTGNADTTYVDNDVEVGQRYFYQIKAINDLGTSGTSKPARIRVR